MSNKTPPDQPPGWDEDEGSVPVPSIVPADIPPHSPAYLRAWIEKVEKLENWSSRDFGFERRVLADRRMEAFWDWLATVRFERHDRVMRSSLSVVREMDRATRLPGKPGDMTPTQRREYFAAVRKHVGALIDLLTGTKFDRDDEDAREVSSESLQSPLGKFLQSWGVDENDEGHVVAYLVNNDGQYQMPYDYPGSHLTETLMDVYGWTTWDDQWDGSFDRSSAPIAQSSSESTPIIYFTCTVHQWFKSKGVSIPFPVLATLAEVALDLGPERQLDGEIVRKQVRRYEARMAKRQDDIDVPF